MILKAICFIIGVVLVILGAYLAIENAKIRYLILCILGIAAIAFSSSFYSVPTGYVAVRRRYGQIADVASNSGHIWKIPFTEEIHLVNCKIQEKKFGDQKIWCETSERTEIYCKDVIVDYQIEPEYAAWIWSNIEEYDTKLVKSTNVDSGLKAATKKFNDVDVTDRNKIGKVAKEEIQKSLNDKYKKQVVTVVSVTIGDMNYSDLYNKAIEDRAKAKIDADTAAEKERKAKVEAEGKAERDKIEAQGRADADEIEAKGKAAAIRTEAEAKAYANKIISESLTENLIESQKVEKWNGDEADVIGGDVSPIIDMRNNKSE